MPGRLLATASTPLQYMDASAVNKRASGRVRRHPEAYTSSPFTSSAKRKRDDDVEAEDVDVDREMPDDYVSDEDAEEEEAEPDEEEVREQKKRARKAKTAAPKKPAQKKVKVNGASLPIRSATGGARKRAPKKAKAVNPEDAAAVDGLYAEVFASSATLDDIVGSWLSRFDADNSNALAEVVNFVLRCAGCEGEVTEHEVKDIDGVTNKLEDLRDEYQASNPTDYPLIAKGKVGTSFKQGLVGFFDALVKATAVKGVLYENVILHDTLQNWVSTMSSAPNRSFRHTATVASLSIVSALCEVARENADESSKSQRQAETEGKKARANKDRVKQMQQKSKEKVHALEIIEPMLKDWFDVVFIHRYRDVDPLIRRECVAALGDWIVVMPDVFFDGQHLRYLGWVLSDTSAATRAEVIKQLHRLYKEESKIGGLKTFTEKFRPRLVEIGTNDAETSVRVAGIELLGMLREHGMLEPDDTDAIGRMIFDTDTRVRKTIAVFFAENVNDLYNSKVDDLGGLHALTESLPELDEYDNDAPRLEWLKFKSLAETLQSYDMDENLPNQVERSRSDGGLMLGSGAAESRFSLAADVLYEKLKDIKDWQAIAGYLLFDHSSGGTNGVADDALSQLKHEAILAEKEEIILLEVLNASTKRHLTGLAEQLKAPKTKLTKIQREQVEEEQEEAARHLANIIPRLLKKFGDASSTAAAVLRVEAVLSLPELRHLQQDSATYAVLLDDVRKQFMSHGTDAVLAPASNAILHAKSYGELEEVTEEKVAALWEDVINNLAELLDPSTVTIRGASQYEELTALSNNLLRITRLASVSDCIPALEDSRVASKNDATAVDYQGAIDYIIALVQRAKPAGGPAPDAEYAALEDEVAARAADAALFYMRWKLKSMVSAVTSSTGAGVSNDELEALAARRDTYVENLESALDSRKPADSVCVPLSISLLDLYANAAILRDVKRKPGLSDDYTALVMSFTPTQQNLLMRVFAGCEKNVAKLSGKKLEAADQDADAVDDDPMSDPESDDEEDESPQTQSQAFQQRREQKLVHALVAEQKLCQLTGKIIHAVFADVMDETAVRERLGRNKTRLGQNFKEVIAYLDLDEMRKKSAGKAGGKKGKGKGKVAATNGAAKGGKGKASAKSNAIVADDEMEDEIEDVDGDVEEEARRERDFAEEEEAEAEVEDDAGNGAAQEEAESALGD